MILDDDPLLVVYSPPPPRCDQCAQQYPDEDLVFFDDEVYCIVCWEAGEP